MVYAAFIIQRELPTMCFFSLVSIIREYPKCLQNQTPRDFTNISKPLKFCGYFLSPLGTFVFYESSRAPEKKIMGKHLYSHGRDSSILLFNCFALGHVNSVICRNIVQKEPDIWYASKHQAGTDVWCCYAYWTWLTGNSKSSRCSG